MRFLILLCFLSASINLSAQSDELLQRVRQKLNLVNDYIATASMKTDVSFIKSTMGKVMVYYKKPDKVRIKKENGISLLPRIGLDLTLSGMLNSDVTVIDAGEKILMGRSLRILKLIPSDDKLQWVISSIWIEPKDALIYKAVTTTKDKGTFDVQMEYGDYIQWALPSKVIFGFDTKEYKLPAGITMEFGGEEQISNTKNKRGMKGTVEITYSSYKINKGLSSEIFKGK
ncbi:MAG: LolA family protein [Chitinophagaceae bacterium]